MKEYDEQVHVYRFDNLDEMTQFLTGRQPPKLVGEESTVRVNPHGDHFKPRATTAHRRDGLSKRTDNKCW